MNYFAVADEPHVTVTTNPANGPFQIGQEVQYFCSLDGESSSADTDTTTVYYWEFKRNGAPYDSILRNSQNLMHQQGRFSFRFIWFFCKAFVNSTFVGLRSTLAEYQGMITH